MTRPPRPFAAMTIAALLVGCTVGPDFRRPAAPGDTGYLAPAEIRYATGGPVAATGEGPTLRWWTAFGSPVLDALVDQAIARNRTLAASNATLAASREQVAAIRGRQLPQIDATARVEHETVNLSAYGFPGTNPEFSLYSVGGGISYDVDLFGGTRRRVEQAAAQAETQLRQTQAAHLAVAGQVVDQVLTIAAIRAQIATAEALLADDRRNVELTQRRKEGGEGTLVEVLTAQSQFEADRAEIPQLSQQLAEARHLLATLVGLSPANLDQADFDFAQLSLPVQIPVTLPSSLVHKRPDILQAEASFHAATAAVGVATAQLYPDITLGATVTQGTPNIGDIVSSAFRGYDIFGGLSAPIFHGGTLKAERRAAVDRATAAEATYQQTVLDAFRQVADLLQSIDSDQRSVANQRESVQVAQRSLDLSRRSFQVGNTGILQILDAERLYQRASANLVDAQARQFLNVARLYVATAGGWTGNAVQPTSETVSTGH
ncbi:efflux transporter outer membrane subunit [Sphingomonas bacterium]|uniref:efflux transporter outer membrane subunit n=1 Tax=Sphingomonas bacterium TaxID=1895847 RepID=UPI0020C5D71E|nr:efflux transporter outer membrane subunit [Sphingomonas bacterium]